MKIIDYIKGDRRGKGSNELEREALRDPFLADALEGYEAAKHENHFDRLMKLNACVARRSERNKHRTLYRTIGSVAGIAAVVAVGFGVWTLLPSEKTDEATMQAAMLAELEGTTMLVGTTEQLLAMAQSSDAYRDVWSYDGAESFFADQPTAELKIENEKLKVEDIIETPQNSETIQLSIISNLDTITNPAFVSYFEAHRKTKNVSGAIVMEFRIGDSGRPSRIQVLSAPTQDAGREAIELLISGPAWQPTGGYRVRTILVVK